MSNYEIALIRIAKDAECLANEDDEKVKVMYMQSIRDSINYLKKFDKKEQNDKPLQIMNCVRSRRH